MTTTPDTAPRYLLTDHVTLTEAAALTGRDRATIKRDLSDGRYPHARHDDTTANRQWLIPVADLVAAGRLDAALVEQVEVELAARRESREVRELRERAIRLEEQLSAALNKTALLESTVCEQRQRLDEQHALLVLLAKRKD